MRTFHNAASMMFLLVGTGFFVTSFFGPPERLASLAMAVACMAYSQAELALSQLERQRNGKEQ
jgi:hypothetical protein